MTRAEAITNVRAFYRQGEMTPERLIAMLEGLGVLKFDKASPPSADVVIERTLRVCESLPLGRTVSEIKMALAREGYGIVRADGETAAPTDALNRLQNIMVEINASCGERSGRLTEYGAGCVIEGLRMGDFKIVKAGA